MDEAGSRRYHISAGWLLSIEVTGMGGLVGHVSVDAGGLFVADGAVEVLFVFVFGFFLALVYW